MRASQFACAVLSIRPTVFTAGRFRIDFGKRVSLVATQRIRKIGSLVSQLMSRRGYAEQAASSEFHAAIVASVGNELSASVRVGQLRQGVLQVFATDSVTLQELNFQKRKILRAICNDLPHANVTDLRFRIQT